MEVITQTQTQQDIWVLILIAAFAGGGASAIVNLFSRFIERSFIANHERKAWEREEARRKEERLFLYKMQFTEELANTISNFTNMSEIQNFRCQANLVCNKLLLVCNSQLRNRIDEIFENKINHEKLLFDVIKFSKELETDLAKHHGYNE